MCHQVCLSPHFENLGQINAHVAFGALPLKLTAVYCEIPSSTMAVE